MTHARTFPRYVGAAGLIAGLLVAFPSLSHASWQAQITDVRPTGNSTPTHIEARVSSNYRFSANDPRFYNRSLSLVSRQTVRIGALAALGRGVMHPGFAVAIAAVGWAWSLQDGIHVTSSVYDVDPLFQNQSDSQLISQFISDGRSWHFGSSYTGYSDPLTLFSAYIPQNTSYYSHLNIISHWCSNTSNGVCVQYVIRYSTVGNPSNITITSTAQSPTITPQLSLVTNSVPESELSALDEHLPDVLLREIYQADTYPEPWYESLNVSSLPLSQVASPNGQAAPEIFEDVAKLSENMTAQINGDPEPHPGTNVAPGGNTAQDEMLDRWDEPVPNFTEVNPEWQVETIDELPSYNIGIGSGQCPSPTVINLPFPLNSNLVINWQPFCDLAAMIRGAVIAVAMILSLYIVLRRG
ncbi:virulence factor TspB C-terminal domain-related protein [Halomonas sp. JS92-SW72]|uniref:virulence factor TspB C-terminal domain-related protein n=1 Tax=Halomonas sp. JS92-SW72 TaxID=2306583 RepID=UPI0013C2B148|nr:virulence factor TspB C-terminal domain-related protein [Halomonas sp. JS92-SW72]